MAAETYITLIVGAALTFSTSMVLFRVNREAKKADERHAEGIQRELLLCTHRSDEAVLLLEVAQAVQEKRCNGELKKAKEQFAKTNRDYEDFVRKQASTRLAGK
jgi:hypothetical protein